MDNKFKVFSDDAVFKCSVIFRDYPVSYREDIELAYNLFERESFLIWPCGGMQGPESFRHPIRPYRPEDLIKVQVSSDIQESYSKNVYTGNINMKLDMVEVSGP